MRSDFYQHAGSRSNARRPPIGAALSEIDPLLSVLHAIGLDDLDRFGGSTAPFDLNSS